MIILLSIFQTDTFISLDVLVAILISLALFAFMGWGVKSLIAEQRKRARMYETMDDAENEPVQKSVGARVLAKRIDKRYLGRGRGFEYRFIVTFWTDHDDDVEYSVPQELYDRIAQDQTGTLVTLNDQFFDFGDGEPIL